MKWKPIFNLKEKEISLVDCDNNGKILIADSRGNLDQYNLLGDSVNHYSPALQGTLVQLESERTLNIFTFSYDLQRFEILDRFMSPLFSGRVNNLELGNIRAASLGNNQKIWLYDETNFSLIQYDYRRNIILQEQSLNLIFEDAFFTILEITEYQNTLFMNVKDKGIYLFDNQANYIGKLDLITEQKLSFSGNNIFTNLGAHLIKTDYLSGKTTSFTSPAPHMKVATHHDLFIFYNSRSLQVFEGKLFQK
ncbi:hypothetical protein KZP23_12170 [Echinicola marina]|uniref:hypothetical protein n=1 Tax=Echinicola marina TaxID=2859768 RepID=UPI001CF69717|nr:hypothetical protein [Echinicola marina]UCS91517.1 hypothetical protein KZP23_12170 [Echinicola marina]